MNQFLLSLGSNLEPRREYLANALDSLSVLGSILAVSRVFETKPHGTDSKNIFLNQAVILLTDLSPAALLNETQKIEIANGRVRKLRWGDRTLDIDIILCINNAGTCLIINQEDLCIPHPLAHERLFVLEPANEIAAEWLHPVYGLSIASLLKQTSNNTKDQPIIRRYEDSNTKSF